MPVGGKAGAFFLYEDETGKRLSVIVGRNPDNRDTSFRFASSDGVETFYWIDKDLGYAVSGEISRTGCGRWRKNAIASFRAKPPLSIVAESLHHRLSGAAAGDQRGKQYAGLTGTKRARMDGARFAKIISAAAAAIAGDQQAFRHAA